MERKRLKYDSHDVHNEFLSIMVQQVLRQLATSLQSAIFFALMVDETTDKANRERVFRVFRKVNDALTAHEEFVGLYLTDSIASKALVALIKDVLLRMNLKIEHFHGQYYDGASSMTGAKSGVAKISKFIKKSPTRDAAFQKLKADLAPETPGFRILCPTCWTVGAASLRSVIGNYQVLLQVWQEALDGTLDGEMRARITGVETQMMKLDFFFGVSLGSLILCHSDNLSKSLQYATLSAAEGQHIAKLTLSVLKKMHCDEQFAAFYQLVTQRQTQLGISDPSLPRRRQAPQHLQVGSSSGDHHVTPEAHYHYTMKH